ncbi:MAG: tetratricopeptide repeat protein [bacterium]
MSAAPFLLLPLLGACSAPALPPDYYVAERLERQGRFDEAQKRYAEAARTCTKKRPACATTAMRSAQMWLKLGQPRKAATELIRIARGVGRGLRIGARALVRAGEVRARLGDWGRAEALWWEVIDSYPTELPTDDALLRLIQRYRDQGRLPALLPLLRARYRRFQQTDIGDNLLFFAARILEKDLHQPARAAALYLELARSHGKSPLRDDALWLAASIRRAQKRPLDAILIYKQLLATREDAMGGASYHSVYLDDSQFAIAKIWLQDLRRPKRALAEFREVLSSFPTSVLRDDAQFWIVLVEIERGRREAAAKEFRKLKRDFPDSRYSGEEEALKLWSTFRTAARAGEEPSACRAWARLRRAQPRSWLARHAPRLPPWPKCAHTGASARGLVGLGGDA